MATVSAVYPQEAKFDLDYYLKTHMPLVQESWTKYGLKSWKVVQFGPDSPYKIQAILEFSNVEEFKNAGAGPEAAAVMGDIKSFSSKDAIIMPGQIVKTS